MEAAAKVQSGYLKRVERGLDPKDTPTASGIFAVERMLIAWMTWRYKATLDIAQLGKQFSTLSHDVLTVDVAQPTIAVSSLFSVGAIRVEDNDDVLRVHLNVLPIDTTKTAIIFSYLHRDSGQARAFLSHILQSNRFYQLYEISRLVLARCDNFVIAPDYFDQWTTEKQKNVRNYFIQTLFQDAGTECPDLYLF